MCHKLLVRVARCNRMAAKRNRDGAALSLFAEVLRDARHKAGLNSDELGDKIGYAGATVRLIESGHRVPKHDFAARADEFFGYPGIFVKMEERLQDLPFPE